MNEDVRLENALVGWSTGNAAALVVASGAVLAGLPLALLSVTAALSFAALLYANRGRWTPRGRFGSANAVTFARIAGILALPWMRPGPIAAAAALALFALDGMDGWIARRTGLAGPFGAFADKEGDALLVLILCLLLYRLPGGLGPWVLIPGLLRYAFVLLVALARPPRRQEVRTARGVWIAGLTTFVLIVALAAYPGHVVHAGWLVAAVTVALCYSFADSACRIYALGAPRAK